MLSEILKMMGGLDILSLLCHVNIILCPLHVAGDTILQGAWCEIRFLRDFYLTTIHMMAVKGIPTNLVWLKQIKDRNYLAWRKKTSCFKKSLVVCPEYDGCHRGKTRIISHWKILYCMHTAISLQRLSPNYIIITLLEGVVENDTNNLLQNVNSIWFFVYSIKCIQETYCQISFSSPWHLLKVRPQTEHFKPPTYHCTGKVEG